MRAGTLGGLLTVAQARRLFSPETTYLNTASYGLPPRPAFEALQVAADEWRHGRTGWHGWDRSVGEARAVWARMHGVPVECVAVGNQVSSFAGVVALSLPRGARVVCAEGDFTSVLWPFLVDAGVAVDIVALEDVPAAVRPGTALVAVSAVQSLDGRVADLDEIAAAAASVGARTFIDGTQASGWLPIDASRFDYVASSGYKWLLSPRGVCFMAIRPGADEPLRPYLAGWYAGEEPFDTNYGAPLRLAADARPHRARAAGRASRRGDSRAAKRDEPRTDASAAAASGACARCRRTGPTTAGTDPSRGRSADRPRRPWWPGSTG